MSHTATPTSTTLAFGAPLAPQLPTQVFAPEPDTVPRVPLPSGLSRACLAAKTAVDNKGSDVRILDLRGLTPMFDFFVLATGQSRRQVHTIVEDVDAAMRGVGDKRMAVEGYDSSKWVVQDYGDVVVHVFDGDTREYYKLEELWADAKDIDWEREGDYPLGRTALGGDPDDDDSEGDDDAASDDDADDDPPVDDVN